MLPRWSELDEVIRWRLKYRCSDLGEPDCAGAGGGGDDGRHWLELELRAFTRELPLTGLQGGRAHLFKVAVETPNGWSGWSPIVACVPPTPNLPGKCAAVYALVKDNTTALVRWTKPIDFAASATDGQIRRYKLRVTWKAQRSEDQQDGCQLEIPVEQDVDSFEVPDLRHEREYRFQVAAESAVGWGDYSDPSPVLLMPAPVPPKLLSPTLRKARHHSLIVQWQHPRSLEVPILFYRFRYTTSEDWSHDVHEVRDVAADLSQFMIENLRPGELYYVQAQAQNRFGLGIWSDSSIPLRTLDPSEPSKVVDISIPHVYRSFITLKWPPAESNGAEVTKHLLRCAHKPDMTDAVEVNLSVVKKGDENTVDLKHLEKTQYYFQIAAANKLGMSEWSDPVAIDLKVPLCLEEA